MLEIDKAILMSTTQTFIYMCTTTCFLWPVLRHTSTRPCGHHNKLQNLFHCIAEILGDKTANRQFDPLALPLCLPLLSLSFPNKVDVSIHNKRKVEAIISR